MGSFSFTHLLILALIALIFFGPRRLPELGKSMGKAIKGFKEGLNGADEKQVSELQLQDQQQTEKDKTT